MQQAVPHHVGSCAGSAMGGGLGGGGGGGGWGSAAISKLYTKRRVNLELTRVPLCFNNICYRLS